MSALDDSIACLVTVTRSIREKVVRRRISLKRGETVVFSWIGFEPGLEQGSFHGFAGDSRAVDNRAQFLGIEHAIGPGHLDERDDA